jgi:hypothetical protein
MRGSRLGRDSLKFKIPREKTINSKERMTNLKELMKISKELIRI